jgi:predicted KAP-like P-loop ATPase
MHDDRVQSGTKALPVDRLVAHPDTPATRDCLRFERYTRPLVQLLEHQGDELPFPPFSVGLFGPWGCGKSTVLRLVRDRVRNTAKRRCLVVEFNPWIHRKEPNLLTPLLHTIHDALAEERSSATKGSARKLLTCLTRLGADAALRFATAGAVNLKQIEDIEDKYLKETATARSELRQLRTTLRDIAHGLAKRGTPLALFVDDLDRCEPIEIVDVLEAIKLFLDVDNVICVIAVDRSILDVGIEARYLKAGFPPATVSGLGARYLDKIVQLPLYVLPLSDGDIDTLIASLALGSRANASLASVRQALLPNPRHIKRIANMLTSTLLTTAEDAGLDDQLVAKLAVLRVQFPDVFEAAVVQPDFLLAFAAVYRGDIDTNREDDFHRYRVRPEQVKAMRAYHQRVELALESLFKDGKPLPSAQELRRHLFLAA